MPRKIIPNSSQRLKSWAFLSVSRKYYQNIGKNCRLFVIENKSLDEPLKQVYASVYNGMVIYLDINGNQLDEKYQETLPRQVADYLLNSSAEEKNAAN